MDQSVLHNECTLPITDAFETEREKKKFANSTKKREPEEEDEYDEGPSMASSFAVKKESSRKGKAKVEITRHWSSVHIGLFFASSRRFQYLPRSEVDPQRLSLKRIILLYAIISNYRLTHIRAPHVRMTLKTSSSPAHGSKARSATKPFLPLWVCHCKSLPLADA